MTRRWLTPVPAILAAIVLTACGGQSDSNANSADGTTTISTSNAMSAQEVAAVVYDKYDQDINLMTGSVQSSKCPSANASTAETCSALLDDYVSIANQVADDIANAGVTINSVADAVADVKAAVDGWEDGKCILPPTYSDPAKGGLCQANVYAAIAGLLNVSNALKTAAA